MCGRYFIDDEMWREIKKICRQIDDAKLKVTRADVHPTDLAWVLAGMQGIHPEKMHWGFISQHQDGLLINARAETVLSKPSFRNSVQNCRCVIPAAGFYEWNKNRKYVLWNGYDKRFFVEKDSSFQYTAYDVAGS